jgi:excinuclease ABC subunit C
VLVPVLPPDPGGDEEWLSDRRGGPVSLRVPQRGDKKALLDTVARTPASRSPCTRPRASDLTTRSRALHEIQEALGLDDAPLRIECYDVSNLQGTHVVASMVVFEDGLAASRSTAGSPSAAWTAPTTSPDPRGDHPPVPPLPGGARQTGELDSQEAGRGIKTFCRGRGTGPAEIRLPAQPGRRRRRPGSGGAAARALAELGIDDVAVCGLAKRLEEVWLPGEEYPVILPRSSEGLYLLQRVRDEAHRFAITYHRPSAAQGATVSELDDVPGPRPGPAGHAAEALRLGPQARRPRPWRRSRPCPASARKLRRRSPRPCTLMAGAHRLRRSQPTVRAGDNGGTGMNGRLAQHRTS